MTRRRLRPEERDLWQQVADRTTPLAKPRPRPVKEPLPFSAAARAKTPAPEAPTFTPKPFRVGQAASPSPSAHDLAPGVTEGLRAKGTNMDKKAHGRMVRGRLKPEARIDLHGKTMDQAHGALTAFILRAHASGKRLVLVITGKGKDRDDHGPIPIRHGVLRHNVPHWLSLPPLREAVLQVTPAHQRHGGSGAYYVYLRRLR